MKHPISWTVAPLGALLLASATVSATPVTLQTCSGSSCWTGDYDVTSGVTLENAETMPNNGGTGSSVVDWEKNTDNGLQLTDWSITVDSDPLVTNNFAITNTGASTQTFTISTSIGVLPAIPSGLMRGTAAFTLTSNPLGSGATLATSGASIYQGLIDGTTARTLWDSNTFTTTTSTSGNLDFGFPSFEIAPEPIDTSIGITITFSLSAGDSASFTSNFEVVPVPLPAALWLFGSGLIGLVGIARRRRS